MKSALLASIFALAFVANVASAANKEMTGKVKGDFPSEVVVIDENDQMQTYHYAPLGDAGSLLNIYDEGGGKIFVSVAGETRSMCMSDALGTLVDAMHFDYTIDGSSKVQTLVIPAGTTINSTCPAGSHNASDLSFEVKTH